MEAVWTYPILVEAYNNIYLIVVGLFECKWIWVTTLRRNRNDDDDER